MKQYPKMINPAQTFDALVSWFHDEMIVNQRAPGFLVGLSGTDSLVAFCAAAKALEKAGKGNRMLGVHFAPSEDFLYDHPEAQAHTWFREQVIPWLKKQFPEAQIVVNTSIDWRCDGLRWGYLMDASVVVSGWTAGQLSHHPARRMLLPKEQYWLLGTRNHTEDVLLSYSNASTMASLQPLIHLWKSEILQISEYLGVPKIAIDKSCETDCICGRLALSANHIAEVDALLLARKEKSTITELLIPTELKKRLISFIDAQIIKNAFKKHIPYVPNPQVLAFESGSLDIKKFGHFGHLYIAFEYLRSYSFDVAVERYVKYLKIILDSVGQSPRFSLEVTKAYFAKLDKTMKEYPAYNSFEELAEGIPSVMDKISA